jgi:transposase
VQLVVGLIVTPEGFPLAYEVLAGNTSDKTTLEAFLQRIETQYGQAQRIWVMDRGIPTEKVLEKMRTHQPPIYYLVGTPKGRLSQFQAALLEQDWHTVREGVEVKLVPQEGELYVLTRSQPRRQKERAMRRRQLKRLWQRLKELQRMPRLSRDQLLLKLGAARSQAPAAWRLVALHLRERRGTGQCRNLSLRIVQRALTRSEAT